MTPTLLPCPFCASVDVRIDAYDRETSCAAVCQTAGCRGSSGLSNTPDEAIARWNRRAGEEELEPALERHSDELAWCVQVYEDVAQRLDDTWPNDSLLNRCERAMRWFVGEIERLEKIVYPLKGESLEQPNR